MAPNKDLESTSIKSAPKSDIGIPSHDASGISSPTSDFSFRFSAFEPMASSSKSLPGGLTSINTSPTHTRNESFEIPTPRGLTRIDVCSIHSRGDSSVIPSPTSEFSFRYSTVESQTSKPDRKPTGLTRIKIPSRDAIEDPFKTASPASMFSFKVFSPTSIFSRISSMIAPPSRLERLPAELHLELVGHLDAESARTMRHVSKYWRSVVTQYRKDTLSVKLPVDVQLQITGYLDVESLVTMRKTSKYWRSLIRKHGKNPETVNSTRSALLCTYDECLGRGTSMYWRLWIRILRTIQRENPWV